MSNDNDKDFKNSYKNLHGVWDELFNIMVCRYHNPKIICKPSTTEENREKHIDCWINGDSYDNKGTKRIGYLNENGNDYGTWLENTAWDGKVGWLRGEAKYITFKRMFVPDILIAKRVSLLKLYKDKVDKSHAPYTVFAAEFQKYRVMTRLNSYGKFTYEEVIFVPFTDIIPISKSIIIPPHLHVLDLWMESRFLLARRTKDFSYIINKLNHYKEDLYD